MARRLRTQILQSAALLAIATATVLALMVAACGSSASNGSSSASSGATEDSAVNSNPAEGGASGSDPLGELPGSEEFGLTMQELALRVEQVEGSVGSCMAAAGFEYIPVDFDTIREAQGADQTAPGVSDEDFLDQFGFGLTTLAGQPNAMIEIAKGQNTAIFEALPDADKVAYTRTLLGENEDAAFVFGLEDEDFSETGGCTRDAVEQFFSADELNGNYVNPGDILIDNDPRMVQALADWSSCVAEEGFDYATPDDLDDDLVDQLDAILGDQEPADLTGASLDALNELQGFERAIASLAEDCDDEHIVPAEEQIEIELYGAPQN